MTEKSAEKSLEKSQNVTFIFQHFSVAEKQKKIGKFR